MSNAIKSPEKDPWPILALPQRVIDELNLESEQPFRGLRSIICQHLLPSIVPLFEALFRLGLNPKATWIIGKCYSTAPEVVAWLQASGCHVSIAAAGEPGRYDESLRLQAQRIWRTINRSSEEDGIIGIDHVGFLRDASPTYAHRPCVFIEHTSRGIRTRKTNQHLCIDMARSHPKREVENHVIAQQILRALEGRPDSFPSDRIGIFGMGPVGRALANALVARGCAVTAYDPAIPPQQIAASGASPCRAPRELMSRSRLILGCTGSDISHYLTASGIQEISLASCSSSDTEFSALLTCNRDNLVQRDRDFIIERPGQRITIFDRGFPINFGWALHHTHPGIEITRTLTLLAMVQASRLLRRDLYLPLDSTFCELTRKYTLIRSNAAPEG